MKKILLGLVVGIGALLSIVDAIHAAPCPAGTISYWKLDETSGTTVFDSYVYNDGLNYGATINQTGRVGTAYGFDGVDDYVKIPDSSTLDLPSSFTYELWIYPNQVSYQKGLIMKDNSLYIKHDSRFIVGVNTDSEPFDWFTTSDGITANAWHHCVFTRDGATSTGKLYIDGVLKATRTITGNWLVSAYDMKFGWSGSDEYYNGKMDEVAIYDHALLGTEITEHYQNGLAGQGYCDPPLRPVALLGYIIYRSGNTYYVQNRYTEVNDYSGTNPNVAIQYALNALTNGRTWQEEIYFKGNFDFGTNPRKINLPSYVILDFSGAVIKVQSNLSTTNTVLFSGKSISNVTVQNGVFDGIVGTRTSSQEPFAFFYFIGTGANPCSQIKVLGAEFKNISGVLAAFQYCNYIDVSYNMCKDNYETGGLVGDIAYVSYGKFTHNVMRIWDTPVGALGSDHLLITDNIFEMKDVGYGVDLINNTATTDVDSEITIADNQFIHSAMGIGIHDTLNTTFKNIKIRGNIFSYCGGLDGQGHAIGTSVYNDIEGFEITDNLFVNCDKAIILGGASGVTLRRVQITNNSFFHLGDQLGPNLSGIGIWNNNVGTVYDQFIISGNVFYDISTPFYFSWALSGILTNCNISNNKFLGSRTPARGIELQPGSSANRIFENTFSGLSAGAIITGTLTGTKIQFNIGYATYNSGTSTGTGSQQAISHGLALTPNRVFLSNEDDGANPYQSAVADATNIYITAVNGKKYQWKAKVE